MLLPTTAVLLTRLLGACVASAQPQPAPAPAADQGQQGVLVFTPDFFTQYRPNTAIDMIGRVPGFGVVDGDGSRGFEGAVGNILINGARPASKSDSGSSAASRILATQVERIELIRGGAPGIDMQGFSVVVNVITKTESTTQSILSASYVWFDGGHDLGNGTYQFTSRDGDRTWGVTLSDGMSMSDANGVGRSVRTSGAGVILRDEDFYNDQYGGNSGVRVNFAQPFMGGKIDVTARYGVNDYYSFTELIGRAHV